MARRVNTKVAAAKSTSKKAKSKGKNAAESADAPAEGSPAEAPSTSLNKAQAVRDALVKNPKGTPKEISADLKSAGLDIAASYVSLIKWQAKKSKRKSKKSASTAEVASSAPASSGEAISIESLIQAKKLAAALGGVEVARKALSALSRLMD